MNECQKDLRDAGKPYPRTCAVCGLGPCRSRPWTPPVVITATRVAALETENAELRKALERCVVDLDACRIITEAKGIGKAYGLRQTLEIARAALSKARTPEARDDQ